MSQDNSGRITCDKEIGGVRCNRILNQEDIDTLYEIGEDPTEYIECGPCANGVAPSDWGYDDE